jgi:hypothetical protein
LKAPTFFASTSHRIFPAAALGLALAAVASSPTPARAEEPPAAVKEWEPGRPIPLGYHTEKKPRRGLIIAGSITFGVSYLLTAVPSLILAGSSPETAVGALPVAGPFGLFYLATRPPPAKTDNNCGNCSLVFGSVFLVDGLAQAAGVAMLAAGLVPSKALVPDDVSAIRLMPTPMRLGKDGTGFGVTGTF